MRRCWITDKFSSRVIAEAERCRGIAFGFGFRLINLGSHYEHEGPKDDRKMVWFTDRGWEFRLYLAVFKLRLSRIRVRPMVGT